MNAPTLTDRARNDADLMFLAHGFDSVTETANAILARPDAYFLDNPIQEIRRAKAAALEANKALMALCARFEGSGK